METLQTAFVSLIIPESGRDFSVAALAQTQEQLRDRLLALTPVSWEAAANAQLAALTADDRPGSVDVPEQWLVLVTCPDEKQ